MSKTTPRKHRGARAAAVGGLALIAGAAVRLLRRRGSGAAPFGALPVRAPDLFGPRPDPTPPVLAAAGHHLGFGQVVSAVGLTCDSFGWDLRGKIGTARVVIEGHVPLDEEFSWFEQEEGATVLHGRRDGRRCHVRVQLATSDPERELAAAQSLLDAVLPPHPS